MAGKGSHRRPRQISREEEDLRYALALGIVTKEMFAARYEELRRKGLIKRDGKVIRARDE